MTAAPSGPEPRPNTRPKPRPNRRPKPRPNTRRSFRLEERGLIGVFGARGFIGRHVCDRLAGSGREVLALDRAEAIGRAEAHEKVRFAAIDFTDPESYREHLAELDAAVLLVSASVPGTFADDMAGEVRENVLPHARFLHALSGTRVRHLVYLSSGGTVYGVPRNPDLVNGGPPARDPSAPMAAPR